MSTWKEGADIDLRKGDVVRALRALDEGNVPMGTCGIVFEDADAFDDGNGPMVRFYNLQDWPKNVRWPCCNVYTGDVVRIEDRPVFEEDADGNAVVPR